MIRNHRILRDCHKIKRINLWIVNIRGKFTHTQSAVPADLYRLGNNSLINRCSSADHRSLHNNRITNNSTFFDDNACADDAVLHFSINLRTFSDDTPVNNSLLTEILWLDHIVIRINLPEFLIQIKFRNDIDQFHVSLPVGSQCSNILPVAIEFIRITIMRTIMYIRNNMHTEITSRLILQSDQRLSQYRPVKDINTHRRKVTARLRRFLLKILDIAVVIGNNNAKTAGLSPRYRHAGNCHICPFCFMVIQHHFIIHLINMVTTKDQYILRIVLLNIFHILINSIGCSCIPV